MSYYSKFTGKQVEDILDDVANKASNESLLLEQSRAIIAEGQLQSSIDSVNSTLLQEIQDEQHRAIIKEQELQTLIFNESTRAEIAEQSNASAIAIETERARKEENNLATSLLSEESRAKKQEQLLQTAINVLNGTDEGSVHKAVVDGIATIVANAPENFDTLKEIANYIEEDETRAANISNQLSELNKKTSNVEKDVNTIKGDYVTKSYFDDAFENIELPDNIYIKPDAGIPISDLNEQIQTSLNKAETALQEEQYKGTVAAVDTDYEVDDPLNGVFETLPNGNIKLTINGVSKDFIPSTPSGDPMHYLFVGHGAKYNEGEDYILETEWAHLVDDVEYNATYGLNKITGTKVKTLEYQGVNYDIYEQNHYYLGAARKVWVVGVKSQNGTLVWDDTKVIHRKGYWLLNSIGDLTNQDMADIVNQGIRYLTTPFCYAYHGSQYSEYKGRTNLPSYGGNNIIRNTNLNYAFYYNFSDVAIIGTSHDSPTVFPILNQCIGGSIRHMVGGQVKMVSENGEHRSSYMSTIRISESAKSFKMNSRYISKKSILQAIETEVASSVIVFNLTTSAFNRINNEPDIIEALSNHPNVTLAAM